MKRKFKKLFKSVVFRYDCLYLVYVLFVEKSFNREILSVRSGQIEIQRRIAGEEGAEFRLRRNIHRLEKGLIMRPRRPVFATDYIAETVDAFAKVLSFHRHLGLDCDTSVNLRWYYDVLCEYFDVVASDPIIDPHKMRFLALAAVGMGTLRDVKSIPRQRKDYPACTVTYEDFLRLAKRRRSVRWYLQKSVPRDLIDKALRVAALSPSACNRQPFRFLICDTPGRVKRIASLAGGTKGFTHQFPVIIVVIGCLDAYEHPRDRHLIYIDGSLATMSFMFALETLGLSSCSINWPDVEEREQAMDKELDLAKSERPIMLISIGYADPEGYVPFSEKKTTNTFCTFQ